MYMKTCLECNETKPLEQFPKAGAGRYRPRCKICYNTYQAVQRNKPERKAKIQRSWKEASARYYSTERRRNKTLRQYGLDESKYNEMYDAQNGKCAICEENLRLVVDHCHESGKIRGLLCNQCNIGLGVFQDNVDRLEAAVLYLTK